MLGSNYPNEINVIVKWNTNRSFKISKLSLKPVDILIETIKISQLPVII